MCLINSLVIIRFCKDFFKKNFIGENKNKSILVLKSFIFLNEFVLVVIKIDRYKEK
jgi:hypothetical protein